jgi:hypothetical protein
MSTEQRRARLVIRHLLSSTGISALDAARSVVALHATDPATVYLSVLARCRGLKTDDIARELYDERTLVRMLAMRRTLFVVPLDEAPVLHHAAALDVAARIRARLLTELATAPTDPPMPQDVVGWLAAAEAAVEKAVESLGPSNGAAISNAVPALRTAILPRTNKAYDVRRTVTTQVLTLMAAEGRLVRGRPLGSWSSRRHTWEATSTWWPEGIPTLDVAVARSRLVRSYLARFGPATEADVAWWTGWSLGTTREALQALDTVATEDGIVLAGDTGQVDVPPSTATLLPALDATPMGWKERSWFLPDEPNRLYDSYGNVGPTVWWCGEVVGGWAVRKDGSIATRLVAERGSEARRAIEAAVERLEERLDGAVVVPSFRTPLERELSES